MLPEGSFPNAAILQSAALRMADDDPLWQKISAFQLDELDAEFSFSDRLARENGWTAEYTGRVIEEYRRFLYLCCVTPGSVTPSDPVDQAWHLHLTFTQSYWLRLCRDTLGRDIHHHPTKGGGAEREKFAGQYDATFTAYTQAFSTAPPPDIWQSHRQRFGEIDFRRVNMHRYWLFKKPRMSKSAFSMVMMVGILSLIVSMGMGVGAIVVGGAAIVFIMAIHDSFRSETGSGDGGFFVDGNGCGSDTCNDSHDSSCGDSGCGSGCSGCSGCGGCGGGD